MGLPFMAIIYVEMGGHTHWGSEPDAQSCMFLSVQSIYQGYVCFSFGLPTLKEESIPLEANDAN